MSGVRFHASGFQEDWPAGMQRVLCHIRGRPDHAPQAMHKGTEHVGKLPQRAHRAMELNDRMKSLTENLQKAVADENYETAASLRDQIKQLEHELAG